MCRWHSMTKREKCRCISLVIVALMTIAGIVAMIYGSVQIFRVSKAGAAADGNDITEILANFVKCSDISVESNNVHYGPDNINHALRMQCAAQQLPARLASGFAGGFMILALLCVPAAFKKDKMFGFTMWSTLAIATIVVSLTVVSVYALPVAAQMVPDCSKYDAATVQELQTLGFVCLKGVPDVENKTTALKWLCTLHTFYAGSALCIASLLLFFMCKHCCCCNANSCCSSSAVAGASSSCGNSNGESSCIIRRTVHKLKARFCRRSNAAAAEDNGMPVSAPSYYQVTESEGASEDAGASPSANTYYGVN